MANLRLILFLLQDFSRNDSFPPPFRLLLRRVVLRYAGSYKHENHGTYSVFEKTGHIAFMHFTNPETSFCQRYREKYFQPSKRFSDFLHNDVVFFSTEGVYYGIISERNVVHDEILSYVVPRIFSTFCFLLRSLKQGAFTIIDREHE